VRRADGSFRARPSTQKRDHAMERAAFVRAFTYENIPCAKPRRPACSGRSRKPHENAMDPHWLARQSCADVEHPELGRSFRYATSKWLRRARLVVGRRAPLLNEDAKTVVRPRERDVP